MRRLLSVIVSLVSVMTFAQKQSAELAPQDSGDMLRIGKSYLGTKYVANTLDRDGEEELVIRTDAVDCLTFVEYTLAQAISPLQKICKRYGIVTVSSTVILRDCIIHPTGLKMVSAMVSLQMSLPGTVRLQ